MTLLYLRPDEILEIPDPDFLGASVVRFQGRVVERLIYSDIHDSVTLADGRRFRTGEEFASYLISQLAAGAYRAAVAQ